MNCEHKSNNNSSDDSDSDEETVIYIPKVERPYCFRVPGLKISTREAYYAKLEMALRFNYNLYAEKHQREYPKADTAIEELTHDLEYFRFLKAASPMTYRQALMKKIRSIENASKHQRLYTILRMVLRNLESNVCCECNRPTQNPSRLNA